MISSGSSPAKKESYSLLCKLTSSNKKCRESKLSGILLFESVFSGFLFDRGAGEIRTPVQTRNNTAFYMFSLRLGFRLIAGQRLPTHSLASIEFHKAIKALAMLGLLLRSH